MSGIRLQKFLSRAGVCSRRRGEAHILAGDVRVNGKVADVLGIKVDPASDRVTFKGKRVEIALEKIHIALNKPKGVVTSCAQPGARIVLDFVDIPERVVPVGRLDKDSTGLLILTNDGALHHALSHPSFDHEKEYMVSVKNPISDKALKRMADGVVLMGRKTRPARVRRISARRFRMVLKEGRNRQIRRMVEMAGNEVTDLKRVRISGVSLGKLKEGAWRRLTGREIQNLRQSLKKTP
ncbi:Pseudouridine synthase [Candidatus Desulfarcum epimagneticum]|uniref:Pseudouridine synthase n=1 Tax=uncultured Desulfobacteraceae bacterium TaxID=218296 RepID=A0A484HDS2_9BACT|nr:Pseudouridine synthase [uncultured Desulfobacteraceae bacterium]